MSLIMSSRQTDFLCCFHFGFLPLLIVLLFCQSRHIRVQFKLPSLRIQRSLNTSLHLQQRTRNTLKMYVENARYTTHWFLAPKCWTPWIGLRKWSLHSPSANLEHTPHGALASPTDSGPIALSFSFQELTSSLLIVSLPNVVPRACLHRSTT